MFVCVCVCSKQNPKLWSTRRYKRLPPQNVTTLFSKLFGYYIISLVWQKSLLWHWLVSNTLPILIFELFFSSFAFVRFFLFLVIILGELSFVINTCLFAFHIDCICLIHTTIPRMLLGFFYILYGSLLEYLKTVSLLYFFFFGWFLNKLSLYLFFFYFLSSLSATESVLQDTQIRVAYNPLTLYSLRFFYPSDLFLYSCRFSEFSKMKFNTHTNIFT